MSGDGWRAMERSAAYTLRFAAIVGVVASAVVATAAVTLSARQEENRLLDRRRKVLDVAGLSAPEEALSRAEITRRFEEGVRTLVVHLETGEVVADIDPERFDPRRASQDPEQSRPAPDNAARVSRLPHHVLVYHLVRGDEVDTLVLPFEGVGLWSTIYGFVALSGDLSTVRGITFYEHAETAGLGALISDADWRALWVGRRLFDDDWTPRLRVIKGRAGPSDASPFEVDGLSGATLTGNGVTEALHFWLGDAVLGAYLDRYRSERGIT
jgi:Na+-transporting NADH:ubiquinone oxidoreductase subunit C